MRNATHSLKLPPALKKAAQRLAKRDGVPLNHGIVSAVAQKIGARTTAIESFKNRAGKSTGAKLIKFLQNAPDSPEPQDKTSKPRKRIRPMSPAAIERAALSDPDAQPLTPSDLKRMKRIPQSKIIRRALGLRSCF